MSASKCFAAAVLASALAACAGAPDDPPPPPPAPTPTPRPPPPSTITVQGKAVNLDGLPVIGLTAVIDGHPAVNVDSTGQFSIANVGAPYDLILINGAAQAATIYRGLTRPDPTIVVSRAQPISGSTATISGTVTGGHYPQSVGEGSYATFASPLVTTAVQVDGSRSAGAFTLPLSWAGATSVTGRLHVFQLSWQGDLPSSFTAYGSAPVTLSAGGSFTSTINVTPTTSNSIAGTIALPGAYSLFSKEYAIHLDGDRVLAIGDGTPTTSFSYVVPNIAGAQFSAMAIARDPSGNAVIHVSAPVAAGGSITLAPRTAPELILPANGAQNVGLSMGFSWTAFTGGVHEVVFAQPDGNGYQVTIVTKGSSTVLPDLSAFGVSLPRSTQLSWAVVGIAPVASMDEVASPAFADRLSVSPRQETFYGFTSDRSFTTAP